MFRIVILVAVAALVAATAACTRHHRVNELPKRAASSSDAGRAEVVDRRRGAFEGIAVGVAVGVGVGVTIAVIDGDDSCDGDFCVGFEREAKALLLGTAAGVLGASVGTLVGYIRGSRDVYEMTGERLPAIVVVPTFGGASAAMTWSF